MRATLRAGAIAGVMVAVWPLGGCPPGASGAPASFDGPDIFFNKDRIARVLGVEMADREAVVREYIGQGITARLSVERTVSVRPGSDRAALGSVALHGQAPRLHRGVGVAYEVYFDDPAVRENRVHEVIEVHGTVREAAWTILGAEQSLRITLVGRSFRRFQ